MFRDDHHRADFGRGTPEFRRGSGHAKTVSQSSVSAAFIRRAPSDAAAPRIRARRPRSPGARRPDDGRTGSLREGPSRRREENSAHREGRHARAEYTSSRPRPGQPMSAFSNTSPFAGAKTATAMAAPRGKPAARRSPADRLTRRLRRTISISLASRPIKSAERGAQSLRHDQGQLTGDFHMCQLDCTRAAPVERNRFDEA